MHRFCELLRHVMKICSMHQDRPFVWKVHWKHLAWTYKLEWEGYQGITRARRPVLSKLMEVQTWWLLEFQPGGERLNKRTEHSASTSFWEKMPLQPSPRCEMTQFLPICSWHLSGYCPSAGAHTSPLRGMSTLQQPSILLIHNLC